jgi:hypothetical protein
VGAGELARAALIFNEELYKLVQDLYATRNDS